jgi:hypothetical protein
MLTHEFHRKISMRKKRNIAIKKYMQNILDTEVNSSQIN